MSDQWGTPASGANIPNYMVLGIVSIFCCWPLAIFALINATKVNSLVAAGDIAGATEASGKAKKFATIAIVIGIVLNVIGGIVGLVLGLAGNIK